MKKIIYILMMSFVAVSVNAQKGSDEVRSGNKLYKSSKFTEAEIAYRKGLQRNSKLFEANYNLGNALFRQKKYSQALEYYKSAISLKPSEKVKIAAAFHNTGNSLLLDKKIEESIKAYEMALKNNSKDNETRYNLAYAQALLKDQKKNKDKNKDKDKNKEQNKDNKQDQPKPDPKPKDQPQQQKPQMSKENAQQILDALQQDEKTAQDKAKKQQVRGTKKADKDW